MALPNDQSALFGRVECVLQRLTGCPVDEIFNGPAAESAILATESVLGNRLPEDLRRAYLWHDGNNVKHYMWAPEISLPSLIRPSFRWVCLREVREIWLMLRDGERAQQAGRYRGGRITGDQAVESNGEPTLISGYDEKRIPVATCDAGAWAFVDLRPSRWGTMGQLVEASPDSEQPSLIATSFTECLRRVTDALDDGRYVFDPEKRMWISTRTGDMPWTLDDL